VTSQNNDTVYTQVTVVELGALENKMVDAAAMKKGLKEEGRIALYGIYFDTAKADVKPESAPTLAEIAKLLKGDASLTAVYIVGHTDSQGGYDYNIDLSRRRAAAIAAELAAKHGIAAARLKTAGVGFLAPVASNATENGRALNRRTELVLP
jgi:outer membrane protein OmpA-like peptidoglycan-associated protein